MLTARVVEGQLDVPQGLLEEGATVTILVPDEDARFDLTDEQVASLRESMAQIERGDWIDAAQLLDRLRDT